jgi:hypothetical protein
MTLAKARLASLARLRKPSSLKAVAEALLRGNERDRARAAEFIAKAKRIEHEQTAAFATSITDRSEGKR